MSIRSLLRRYISEQHWTIGIIQESLEYIVSGKPFNVHYIKKMPKDRWFADPFILDYDAGSIQLLVEEFCYKIRRGRISKLIIDRYNYELIDYKIILDLPTHLSFPFIQRKKGKIYVCPENSESGEWTKYEYNVETNELIKVESIIHQPLTDAIITDSFGRELIFSTQIPTQNGNILAVYSADGKLEQNCIFPSNVARNAGAWFEVEGRTYRVAQDCNGGYGRAVVLQEVRCDNEGTFHFDDIRRIESTNPYFITGCHTFNSYNGLSVIDVHGRRRPRLDRFTSVVQELLNMHKFK